MSDSTSIITGTANPRVTVLGSPQDRAHLRIDRGGYLGDVLMRCTAEAARILVQRDFSILIEMADAPAVMAERMTEGTGLLLRTEFLRDVSSEVREDLEYLSVRRLPARAKPLSHIAHTIEPGGSLETGEVNDRGIPTFWGVGGDELPEDTMAIANEVRRFGIGHLNRAFRLLVWRYLPKGSMNPTRHTACYSMDDGATWFELPRTIRADVFAERGIPRDADGLEVTRLASEWGEVPAAYLLLWEARSLSSTNARLALTMTALEVGAKEFIARCVPRTDWLLENLQSPPVFKLLRDYLPLLQPIAPGYDCYSPPPAEILAVINRGAQARNALLHRGEGFTTKEMAELDYAAHTVLAMLDRYAGEDWSVPESR